MKEIIIKGLKIKYVDVGEGKPVLILHGWLANKEIMAPIYNHLANRFRCVALDFPGMGDSQEQSEPWNNDDYADFVEAFMEAVGIEKPIGIGHSHGGRVLLKMASRKDGLFSKLLLIDAAGIKPKHSISWYVKVYAAKTAKAVLSLPLINKTGLLEILEKHAGSEDYRNSSEILKKTMSKLLAEDLTEQISTISVPTLLVWGEMDTATPLSDAYVMEKKIPNAGVARIPGAGHFSFLDGAAQFNSIMDVYFKEDIQ